MPRSLIALAVAFVMLVVGSATYLMMTQWQRQTLSNHQIRLNRLTGVVQIRDNNGDDWRDPFENDTAAPGLEIADLQSVRLSRAVWGPNGVLFAVAETGAKPLRGRLAFQIVTTDGMGKQARAERSLRRTINWPANATIPFVLATGQETPTRIGLRTALRLETLYNTGSVGETLPASRRAPPPTNPAALGERDSEAAAATKK